MTPRVDRLEMYVYYARGPQVDNTSHVIELISRSFTVFIFFNVGRHPQMGQFWEKGPLRIAFRSLAKPC